MKIKGIIIAGIVTVISVFFVFNCFGFEITEPKDGALFHPGDEIVVKVRTEPNEQLKGIWFYTINMKESELILTSPYEFKFIVQRDFLGLETIVADGKLQNNSHIELKVQINVVLPINVALDELKVDPHKIYLRKVPEGTKGAHFYEKKQLDVEGVYSDRITRQLSSSVTGTKYSSSNENVATVDSEGLVTAISSGTAKIIIRNGNRKAIVDVVVKKQNK
jgi:hypothetical protein